MDSYPDELLFLLSTLSFTFPGNAFQKAYWGTISHPRKPVQ